MDLGIRLVTALVRKPSWYASISASSCHLFIVWIAQSRVRLPIFHRNYIAFPLSPASSSTFLFGSSSPKTNYIEAYKGLSGNCSWTLKLPYSPSPSPRILWTPFGKTSWSGLGSYTSTNLAISLLIFTPTAWVKRVYWLLNVSVPVQTLWGKHPSRPECMAS